MNAQAILDTCDLLIKENCKIVDDALYERLLDHEFKYRLFFDDDDYDYVEDEEMIKRLDTMFE